MKKICEKRCYNIFYIKILFLKIQLKVELGAAAKAEAAAKSREI